VPAVPSWLLGPLWDQFSALLPERPVCDPSHPLGCHQPRVSDRLIFEKLVQVLRFGCSYTAIADCSCGATTIRDRRDEWIKLGIFAKLHEIARGSYDRIVGLALEDVIIDGCTAKAPGGGEMAGRSPVDRGKPGYKRSLLTEGKGIPPDRVLAPADRHDSVLLAATLDKLDEIGPLPEDITVHLDAGYDSGKTRDELGRRGSRAKSPGRASRPLSRQGGGGPPSGPTHGTTTSTGSSGATNATNRSSTRSSTSPTPLSRSAASSAKPGPSTDGTPDQRNAPDHPPIRAPS
jgi:transposase